MPMMFIKANWSIGLVCAARICSTVGADGTLRRRLHDSSRQSRSTGEAMRGLPGWSRSCASGTALRKPGRGCCLYPTAGAMRVTATRSESAA